MRYLENKKSKRGMFCGTHNQSFLALLNEDYLQINPYLSKRYLCMNDVSETLYSIPISVCDSWKLDRYLGPWA